MLDQAETVIDACCLINVCAVDQHQLWLPRLGLRWHVPSAVMEEALYLYGTDEEGTRIPRSIDVQALIEADIVNSCTVVSDEEISGYIEFAAQLDDGEAMALAIARCRGWLLATDDRKALRLANEHGVTTITTPDVMKRWVEIVQPADDEVRGALQCIYDYAKFFPPKRSSLYEWWMSYL